MGESQPESRKSLKVLVVDDEPHICEVMSQFLENEGYEAASADSGVTALSMMNSFDPHIVFLDIRMPDMDGIQCLRRIKDNKKETEVVIMSGFATTQMARKSLEIGAFDYIGKPLCFNHIREVLQLIKISKFVELL